MGHRQFSRLDHEFVVQKQIEVDRSRAPAFLPPAGERVLDGEQGAEQIAGRQIGLDQAGRIEKGCLLDRTAHRPGLVKPTHSQEVYTRHEPEEFERLIKLPASTAHV